VELEQDMVTFVSPSAPDGVPEIKPPAEVVSPAGGVVDVQLDGMLLAVIWYEGITTPVWTFSWAVELVMTGVTVSIVRVKVTGELEPVTLLAPKVTENTPCTVGVPDIKPVVALSVTPAGNPVAE
jgi:hypothetical protein